MKSARTFTTLRHTQFRLSALLEFVTICSVLSASSSAVGVASSVFLTLMALAVWARQGILALLMLAAASLATAPLYDPTHSTSATMRECIVFLLGTGICFWYQVRRQWEKCTQDTSSWGRTQTVEIQEKQYTESVHFFGKVLTKSAHRCIHPLNCSSFSTPSGSTMTQPFIDLPVISNSTTFGS